MLCYKFTLLFHSNFNTLSQEIFLIHLNNFQHAQRKPCLTSRTRKVFTYMSLNHFRFLVTTLLKRTPSVPTRNRRELRRVKQILNCQYFNFDSKEERYNKTIKRRQRRNNTREIRSEKEVLMVETYRKGKGMIGEKELNDGNKDEGA